MIRTGISQFGPNGLSVTYNYLQTTTFDLNNFGNFSNYSTSTQPGVSIAGNILTLVPQNRQQTATVIPITAYNVDGLAVELTLKMEPNIAIDYTNTPILACKTDGTFWKVNVLTSTESLFQNYDGTNLTIADVLTFTVDAEDNLMFYTTNTTPTTIRAYNFATKTDNTMISGVSFNIRAMSYKNSLLYMMSSTDGGVIQTVYINPNVRNSLTTYGAITSYTQPFTNVGCVRDSILAHSNGTLYFSIDPIIGNTLILQCTTVEIASITSPAGVVTDYYLAESQAGRIYAYATSNRRFYNSRIMTTWLAGFTSANDYIDIDRYPYA